MSALLLAIAVCACAALLADAPVLATLLLWIGLSVAVAMLFGAASLIDRDGQ